MDEILNFDVRLILGDSEISAQEAKRLLQESQGLAFIKNNWKNENPTLTFCNLKQRLPRFSDA